ncbi:DUF1687-domain-containing protein [Xylona heveae TC161]|uniref:DUF1687-domain-containing protein n=1 Tax=Xylona heveae (strain CBS 132557 / TC161) TaxID=1328760 RepID=A0A165FD95_XYLHT|nr:DUF1687-domain-containing protein [Xylona heveae TC161]KZF20850.1 DUF1687-domain-containing protein [Xylona heveae TC161]
MFRFHKSLDIITLFHKPSSAASTRVLTLLKQASAEASSGATGDQASDHAQQNKSQRTEFQLDVTEETPTSDQLRSILEYLGPNKAGTLVKGATNEADAKKILSQTPDSFIRPLTVDWDNGRAVAGDNESEILRMLRSLPKETNTV